MASSHSLVPIAGISVDAQLIIINNLAFPWLSSVENSLIAKVIEPRGRVTGAHTFATTADEYVYSQRPALNV